MKLKKLFFGGGIGFALVAGLFSLSMFKSPKKAAKADAAIGTLDISVDSKNFNDGGTLYYKNGDGYPFSGKAAGDDYNAYWDAAAQTLNLKNYDSGPIKVDQAYDSDPVIINLEGDNVITADYGDFIGIKNKGDVTIKGSGTLLIKVVKSSGVGDASGIYADKVYIKGSAAVTIDMKEATSGHFSRGIWADKYFALDENASLSIDMKIVNTHYTDCAGIFTAKGAMDFKSSKDLTINIDTYNNNDQFAIYNYAGDKTVDNNGDISFTGSGKTTITRTGTGFANGIVNKMNSGGNLDGLIKFDNCGEVKIKDFAYSVLNQSDERASVDYDILINGVKVLNRKITKTIKKIELLNKFYGEIKSVTIKVKDEKGQEIKNEIKNNKYWHKRISVIPIEEKGGKKGKKEKKEKGKELFKYGGKIFSEKYWDLNNKYFKVKQKDFDKLKHFGDINSFIPLYKIINYIINEEENNNTNKEEKISKLKNVLANVSQILRTTVKLIFVNKSLFHRLFIKKLYIPLIGALSEILESVNKIKDNDAKIELEKYLLDNEIFFILYIILLNSYAPENIKNTYKSLFITQNCFDKEYTFKDIIFDPKTIDKQYISFYGFQLFYFLEFLLIYAPDKFILAPIYNHIQVINYYYKIYNQKDGKDKIMEFFCEFRDVSQNLKDFDFHKFETETIINSNNCYCFTLFIKTVLNANNKLKKDLIKEIENSLNSEMKKKVIEIISANNEKDKALNDLDNLIEEYRENIDEIEFKLKIQNIINPDLNKLDICFPKKRHPTAWVLRAVRRLKAGALWRVCGSCG